MNSNNVTVLGQDISRSISDIPLEPGPKCSGFTGDRKRSLYLTEVSKLGVHQPHQFRHELWADHIQLG
jgi:hypothetical protein